MKNPMCRCHFNYYPLVMAAQVRRQTAVNAYGPGLGAVSYSKRRISNSSYRFERAGEVAKPCKA